MASIIYDYFMTAIVNGAYNPGTATFKAMLVTNLYNPNQSGDQFRTVPQASEVNGAVGYTAGGQPVAVTVTYSASNAQISLNFSNPSWASSSITARGAVIYNSRGGSPSSDELVAYVDFGMDVTSTNGSFSVIFSTPLVLQNLS